MDEDSKRLLLLETRFGVLIERVDELVSSMSAHNRAVLGDPQNPGILSRVISLEEARKTFRWAIGVLYVALVTAALRVLMH